MSKTKKFLFVAVSVALATILSRFKLMDLPFGGTATACSMLFVCIPGYFFGPVYGMCSGIVYSLIQMLDDPYFLSLPQFLCDYLFAFSALGLAGFFTKGKYSLQIGYCVGVLGRFIFSVISGVVFFAEYAPEGMNPFVYSVAYNGSYLGIELVLTLIVLFIPAFRKAIEYVKSEYTSN